MDNGGFLDYKGSKGSNGKAKATVNIGGASDSGEEKKKKKKKKAGSSTR